MRVVNDLIERGLAYVQHVWAKLNGVIGGGFFSNFTETMFALHIFICT